MYLFIHGACSRFSMMALSDFSFWFHLKSWVNSGFIMMLMNFSGFLMSEEEMVLRFILIYCRRTGLVMWPLQYLHTVLRWTWIMCFIFFYMYCECRSLIYHVLQVKMAEHSKTPEDFLRKYDELKSKNARNLDPLVYLLSKLTEDKEVGLMKLIIHFHTRRSHNSPLNSYICQCLHFFLCSSDFEVPAAECKGEIRNVCKCSIRHHHVVQHSYNQQQNVHARTGGIEEKAGKCHGQLQCASGSMRKQSDINLFVCLFNRDSAHWSTSVWNTKFKYL